MPQNNPLTRASTTIILLFALAIVLALTACGPSTPARATATPAPTTAAPTFTQAAPSPTRTQLPPTAAQAHTSTSTPIANTPTTTPTATAAPTFIAETALNDPGKYKLADWNQQAALDAISILDQQWNKVKEEETWIYAQTSINSMKRTTALVEQEALSRYPQLPSRRDLEWKTALDLATAGQQNTNESLAALLQSELNQQPSLLSSSFSELTAYGFTFEVIETSKLFDESSAVWLVKSRITDDWIGGGGQVFSIHKSHDGNFVVYPVGGYWLSFWAQGFEMYFNPTKPGTKPEVSIAQWSSHGTGFYFRESWLCNYQWQDNQWVPSLTNTAGDAGGTFGLDFALSQFCFIDQGLLGEPVFRSKNDQQYIDTIQLERGLDPESCDWGITYSFYKENDVYQQQVNITNNGPKLSNPTEIYCLAASWDMAEMIENKSDIIAFMENLVADWPDLLNKTWEYGGTIQKIVDTDFFHQLQFELGRFYALSGKPESAKAVLAKIANNSPENSDRWTYIAHHYLLNLDNIDQAEDGLARDLSSICWHCNSTGYVKPIYEKAVAALYTTGSLDSVKDDIQTLTTTADPSCYGGNNYECAELLYLHGLANELDGNTSESVSAYWLVWHHYPKSLYAVAAQQKLEPVKKP